MCGRYFQQRGSASVARYFETVNPLPNLAASFNRAPTQEGLVVRTPRRGARVAELSPALLALIDRTGDSQLGARKFNWRFRETSMLVWFLQNAKPVGQR